MKKNFANHFWEEQEKGWISHVEMRLHFNLKTCQILKCLTEIDIAHMCVYTHFVVDEKIINCLGKNYYFFGEIK